MAGDEPSEGAERDADEPASSEPAGPEDAEGSRDDEPRREADDGDDDAVDGGDGDEETADHAGEDGGEERDDESVAPDDADDGGAGPSDDEVSVGGDGSEPAGDEERTGDLEDVPGVGAAKAAALREAGLSTVADVVAASRDELAEVPGIGDVLAARIQAEVGEVEEAAGRDDVDGGDADGLDGEGGADGSDAGESGEDVGSPEEDVVDADAAGDIDVADTEGVVDVAEAEGDVDVAEAGAEEEEEFGGLFGGGRSGGPADDREMPLADHIREMLQRLAVVIAVAGIVSLLVFPFAEQVINFLWYSILPGVESEIARPRLYGVLELLFTKLKVASLAGLIVALPVLVYETYAFMRPGLYPHERRYYLAAIPTSLVLALVGVSFAYFVVLPAIFVYFLYYSQDVATIGFALGRTFDLVLLLMGYMAIVFQIPLFIMLAMMMGLVTRRWLAGRRLLFWGAFLGISFLFSPDPTGMAPILVAATMIVLFEGTLLLTKWTGRE